MSQQTSRKQEMRVLILASYCVDNNKECTDDMPCIECLKMCNVATIEGEHKVRVFGGYDYLKGL